MSGRLRILFVAPYLPFPPRVGFSIRVFHLLREMARRHEVTLLAYGEAGDASRRDGLRALGVDVRVVPAPARIGAPDADTATPRREAAVQRWLRLGMVATPWTYQGAYLWSRALQRALDVLVEQQPFDLVQLETSELWRLIVPRGPRVLVDELNIEFALRRRIADLQGSTLKRLYNRLESRKFQREEQRCWRRADGVLVVSDEDAEVVRRFDPAIRVTVVPNGIDVQTYHPAARTPQPGSLVFVGRMDYPPNAEGISWFVRAVWPGVRARSPQAALTIIGGPVTPALAQLEGDGVRVLGRVPDVVPYLAQAAVLPIPLRAGGGTRLKVLEGLAMGTPIVSTTIGCEGLRVRGGEHLLIADTAPDLEAAVVRVLDHPALGERLGRAGRALVEREYDWRIVGDRLAAAYAGALAEPSRRTSGHGS